MLFKFIFLLTIGLLAVQGEISQSRIESDAAKWTELHYQYMNQAPYGPYRGQMKTKCQIMFQCCPEERDNFFDLMRQHKFEDICIPKRSSSRYASSSSTCQSLIRQLDSIKKSTAYTRFNNALSGISGSDARFQKWRSQMAKVCSADELEAHYCHPDNTVKFQSCQEKVLRYVASNGNTRMYNEYVREWENHHDTYIQRLSKAFPCL